MKPLLADVNFLLPLLVRTHTHHAPALAWWRNQPANRLGLCRIVQLGVMRLLANPRIMHDHALTTRAAWDLLTDLLADERIDFWHEPPNLDAALPRLLRYSEPTYALVTDSYLAAFALSRQAGLVTFDQGFGQFEGLTLELLPPPAI
jgi:uncharacterized protein